jgi:phosphoribosylanthranilate isomerase
MPLKTLVKVGNISNLSDARYCAGMGAEMLGFAVIEGQNNFIQSKSYQEIRGWISGPSVVAEMYGITPATNVDSIMADYAPDFLEVNLEDIGLLPDGKLPLIVSVDETTPAEDLIKLAFLKERIAFIQVNGSAKSFEFIKKLSTQFPVLATVKSVDELNALLNTQAVSGISLNGSQEIKPGLKDYSHLANVLEILDSDN